VNLVFFSKNPLLMLLGIFFLAKWKKIAKIKKHYFDSMPFLDPSRMRFLPKLLFKWLGDIWPI